MALKPSSPNFARLTRSMSSVVKELTGNRFRCFERRPPGSVVGVARSGTQTRFPRLTRYTSAEFFIDFPFPVTRLKGRFSFFTLSYHVKRHSTCFLGSPGLQLGMFAANGLSAACAARTIAQSMPESRAPRGTKRQER